RFMPARTPAPSPSVAVRSPTTWRSAATADLWAVGATAPVAASLSARREGLSRPVWRSVPARSPTTAPGGARAKAAAPLAWAWVVAFTTSARSPSMSSPTSQETMPPPATTIFSPEPNTPRCRRCSNRWRRHRILALSNGQLVKRLALCVTTGPSRSSKSRDWTCAVSSPFRHPDSRAHRWYDKAVEWRAEKAGDNEELKRFEVEAEEVLEGKKTEDEG